MGLMSWSWLKKEIMSTKRRISAPPAQPAVEKYDPNANREEYLQAFDEFKQRGSLYNQLTIREEGPSTSRTKASSRCGAGRVKSRSKSTKTKLFKKMSRSMGSVPAGCEKKTNTPINTSTVSENNNSIYINEILEFENDNCQSDESFGATGQSPPNMFYRNNSNPFSPNPERSERTSKTLQESRQRARENLLRYMQSNSSNSSGAYREYDRDLDSTMSDDEEMKKSNGQDIPMGLYDEIVNIFGGAVQRNGSPDQCGKQNSPVKPTIENGISGISPFSALTSIRCEGLVDENFRFLNDTEWKNYLNDESESVTTDDRVLRVTNLDEPAVMLDQNDQFNPERCGVNEELDSTMSRLVTKNLPTHIIECKPKEIKPKAGSFRNTSETPFDFLSGSFRKTTVTFKRVQKCSPGESAPMQLIEEAIERDCEILSKVKHPNIVILMAACFQRKLMNHMTLVLEPVDYTLSFYLHQMDKSFSILESISIVQQIASAAIYLHECGYIHSNISSHNVLVRERPWNVKLSSFELAVAADIDSSTIQREMEKHFPEWIAGDLSDSNIDQSMEPIGDGSSTGESECPSKYLVYYKVYREFLSVHNFIAPELLQMHERFVYPSTKTDVYSLCLLLWEILNHCVPFAVYSKVDMERMIASKKLNLPFFERSRCYFFMDVFRAGLAVTVDDRSIDVPQLIELLENIELELLTGGQLVPDESNAADHEYVNYPQPDYHSNFIDETILSAMSDEPIITSNMNAVNDFVLSPSLLDFDISLKECERTSTKKLRKKPQRQFIKNRIRELFPELNENDGAHRMDESTFTELNESFMELSENIRRHVIDDIGEDEKLNENLALIADDLRRKILNDTMDVTTANDCGPAVEIDEPKMKQKIPAVVGFSVKNKMLDSSKSYGNILDGPVASSHGVAKKLFKSEFELDDPVYTAMPNTPIARQNYITRNAWLSNRQPTNGIESMTMENKDSKSPEDDKKVNVSVRIVHSKVTPKKKTVATQPKEVDEGRPSILSKIKFFNETSKPESSVKPSPASVKVDDAATSSKSKNFPIVPVVTGKQDDCSDKKLVQSDGKTMINELTAAVQQHLHKPSDQPKQLFENKLWKRELDICNRSLNSSDGGGNGSKIVTPKFRSVRDTILKFEKRTNRSPSSSDGSPTELQATGERKPNESPTLIKRTVYSERIVAGIDLTPVNDFAGQKVATRVSLRQVRQTSSDVSGTKRRQITGKMDVRHTICGSEIELLSFNAQPGPGPSNAVTKYVCYKCASRMSSDELKALTYEAFNDSVNSNANATAGSPRARCQARVKTQDTRSIEDLYIDDDFVHELGANMELQSDSSDLLDFELFNSNCAATGQNIEK